MLQKLLAVAAIALLPTMAFAQAHSQRQTEAIQAAIKGCIDVVRSTPPPEDWLKDPSREFDAYYDPSTGRIINNVNTVGGQQAIFTVHKCMTEAGFSMH